jgi:catechol 2,3-dioxygenase-like lactoylglutathione lyase family enzyme
MPNREFDRSTQDVGNILGLEHVNVTVPDQTSATHFYVQGMGFTRDPYIDFGPFNVWINLGDQQFHLPTNSPQVIRGHVGVVVPDLDELEGRLTRIAGRFTDSKFSFKRLKSRIDVTCPWGNRIRCFAPGAFGEMHLGMPYVEFDVPPDTTQDIAEFYIRFMGAPAVAAKGLCRVSVGKGQELRFRETRKKLPEYDGHHIAIYTVNFSAPHDALASKKLITEESDDHQYRFNKIISPTTGKVLFEIEHEVRSLYHPMYARHLTNRNASQSFFNYTRGRDVFVP